MNDAPSGQSPERKEPARSDAGKKTHAHSVRSLGVAATGVVGLFFVFVLGDLLARSGIGWMRDLSPSVFWFGIVFLVFYLIAYISHSEFTRHIGGQLASQAALAVFMWFMYTQAALQASVLLNRVYGVDASAFPGSSQVLTFVQMFLASRPLIYLMIVFSLWHFLRYVLSRQRATRISVFSSLIMLSGATIGVMALVFIHERLSEPLLLKKSYLIAKELDFNPRVHCGRVDLEGVGVFLGPEQQRVLVDAVPSTASWTESIYATEASLRSTEVPGSFPVYRCSERDEALPLASPAR
ncbi:hypothetical protein [Diaphorobacter caeni]|uniref:hypothetical protein n=1 Tax=Diaphorobacter caeni TaxID=2784387 RepID=UPI00188FA2BC|nr:hypothetical protein [Diaphorobacter caeni]MBF5007583.1 hypothetical protein [Diaphorobacter caeni]